jgi:hypothetical protein
LRDRFAKKINPMAERPPTSSDVAPRPPPEEFELDSADDTWMHHIRQAERIVALGRLDASQIAHGTTLMDMERYAEAEPILNESLRILQGAFGDTHPNTAKARANLHTLYTRWGKPDKAAEFAAAGG